MARDVLAIFLALLVSIGIWMLRLPSDPTSGFSYFGFETWAHVFAWNSLHLSQELLPGFIVGALLRSRPVLTAAVVSGLASVLLDIVYVGHYWEWPPLLATLVSSAIHGSAGSALGALLLGSYSSLKATREPRMP
jgi:hypothetical protein